MRTPVLQIALALLVSPLPAAALPMAQLAGSYDECGGTTLVVRGDGHVQWSAMRLTAGTDMGITYSGSGVLRGDGAWVKMAIDPRSVTGPNGEPPPPDLELVRRFRPVKHSGRTFLLDEKRITDIVNSANKFYPQVLQNTDCFLHSDAGHAPVQRPLMAPVGALLPAEYSARLLSRPLSGRVTGIGAVSQRQVNTGGWMREAEFATQHSARAAIDLGSRDGVFLGMRLYIGTPPMYEVVVESVGATESAGLARWISPPPAVGMPVSSAAVTSGR